jgi:hypothetical protein
MAWHHSATARAESGVRRGNVGATTAQTRAPTPLAALCDSIQSTAPLSVFPFTNLHARALIVDRCQENRFTLKLPSVSLGLSCSLWLWVIMPIMRPAHHSVNERTFCLLQMACSL